MKLEYNDRVLSAMDTAMTAEEPDEVEEAVEPDYDRMAEDRAEAQADRDDRECERRFG
jgi:hypothetical protein